MNVMLEDTNRHIHTQNYGFAFSVYRTELVKKIWKTMQIFVYGLKYRRIMETEPQKQFRSGVFNRGSVAARQGVCKLLFDLKQMFVDKKENVY